jgi:hypothetical protein
MKIKLLTFILVGAIIGICAGALKLEPVISTSRVSVPESLELSMASLSTPPPSIVDAKIDAASGFLYRSDSNSVTIVGYIGQDGHGIIPATIDGKPVMIINYESGYLGDSVYFYGCRNLISVTIPDSVYIIGHRAFSDSQLTSVTIPNSVTNIGSYAFYCPNLTDIIVSERVIAIGNYAFGTNSRLTVTCPRDSYTHKYCVANGIRFQLTEPTPTPSTTTAPPTTTPTAIEPTTSIAEPATSTTNSTLPTTTPTASNLPSTSPGSNGNQKSFPSWLLWIGGPLLTVSVAILILAWRRKK